jgi:iron complex transport system substrate-binding protein
MLFVSFIYAFTSTIGKLAIIHSYPYFFGILYNTALTMIIVLFLPVAVSAAPKRFMFKKPLVGVILGAIVAVTIFSHMLAISMTNVAYMILETDKSVVRGNLWRPMVSGRKNSGEVDRSRHYDNRRILHRLVCMKEEEKKIMKIMKLFFLIIAVWVFLSGTAFPAPPGRIVSLAPSITEILYDLDLGDRIAAVTTFCDYPPQALKKPKIGGYSNPSIETIVAMKPDMVVMIDDGNPLEIRDRLKKLNINTYVFTAKRLMELPQGIRDLGVALGIKDRAYKRANRIEEAIRQYERKSQKFSTHTARKKVLFIIQPEPLIVAGPGTVIDDALKILGVQNIAGNAASSYPKYSIEDVIRHSPDVIFIGHAPGMTGDTSKWLVRRLNSLDAVKKGRIYYTSESLYRLTPKAISGIEEISGYLRRY